MAPWVWSVCLQGHANTSVFVSQSNRKQTLPSLVGVYHLPENAVRLTATQCQYNLAWVLGLLHNVAEWHADAGISSANGESCGLIQPD